MNNVPPDTICSSSSLFSEGVQHWAPASNEAALCEKRKQQRYVCPSQVAVWLVVMKQWSALILTYPVSEWWCHESCSNTRTETSSSALGSEVNLSVSRVKQLWSVLFRVVTSLSIGLKVIPPQPPGWFFIQQNWQFRTSGQGANLWDQTEPALWWRASERQSQTPSFMLS